jgi:hypothetical protein
LDYHARIFAYIFVSINLAGRHKKNHVKRAAVAQWIKRSACNHKVQTPEHPQKESLVVSGRASDQKMPVKVLCQATISSGVQTSL